MPALAPAAILNEKVLSKAGKCRFIDKNNYYL